LGCVIPLLHDRTSNPGRDFEKTSLIQERCHL